MVEQFRRWGGVIVKSKLHMILLKKKDQDQGGKKFQEFRARFMVSFEIQKKQKESN